MSSSGRILYLPRSDVENMRISMSQIITTLEDVFLQKARGEVEAPPKPGIHPVGDAFIHAMPAYLQKTEVAGLKWVSGFPENPNQGLPYISGLMILNDVATGFPVCVMDCTWLTAKRTGAATAIAAKHLARNDSRTLGILGCGAQGRSNLEALAIVCTELEEVKAFDISKQNQEQYVREMTHKHDLCILSVSSPKEAVEGCDIVVSAGPIMRHLTPLIEANWFEDGGFACSLDFDSYWKPEAMRSMTKFYTDDIEQLKYYKRQGYFIDIPDPYAELADVISGKEVGRENADERIMSLNLGLAIEDVATANLIYHEASKNGIGTRLPL
jgi:ornithine cyclodeaminase/alanine dehydrogenase-like protein (mu-crystallin family)